MRRIAQFLVAGALALAGAWPVLADCPAGAPEGRFAGGYKAYDGEQVEVTLNVVCAQGRYSAQVFTSQGDWGVAQADGEAGRLKLRLGGPAGDADLILVGEALGGPFHRGRATGQLALTRAGPPTAPDALVPTLKLTPAQWREDIAAFGAGMTKRHANAFAFLPKPKFDAEIAALQRDAGRLDGDRMYVHLQRIAAEIGDGHTAVIPPPDRRVLPIRLERFGEDIRITAAGPGLEKALGARVTAIGRTPIAQAWRRALTLSPQAELPQLQDANALGFLRLGVTLHGLGITPAREHAVFSLRDDAGRAFKLDIEGVAPDQPAPRLQAAAGQRGLADQNRGKDFWCQALGTAVYCDWRSYGDLKARGAEMLALVDQAHATKLIVDLRDNGGGDNTEGYRWIVLPLKEREDLNRKGRLYVLIGAQTFSAAMNNAAQFQDLTAATLVGGTIGETPNSYQEPRQFRLPNSHLVVRASTKFYKFRQSGPNKVAPNHEIVPTWDDVKAGRDPVLDWVLAQPTP